MAGDPLSDFISTGAGAVVFSLGACLLIVFRAGLASKAAGQYERLLRGPLRAGPGALARSARFWQGVYLIGGIGAAVLGVVFCAGFLAQCLMAVRGQLRRVQPARAFTWLPRRAPVAMRVPSTISRTDGSRHGVSTRRSWCPGLPGGLRRMPKRPRDVPISTFITSLCTAWLSVPAA